MDAASNPNLSAVSLLFLEWAQLNQTSGTTDMERAGWDQYSALGLSRLAFTISTINCGQKRHLLGDPSRMKVKLSWKASRI